MAEIAALTFSAKSTILRALSDHGIPSRETGVQTRKRLRVAFGRKWSNHREVVHKREAAALVQMNKLRGQGFTYEQVAQALNSLKVPTKTGHGVWHRKTVQAILIRDRPIVASLG